MSDTSKRRSSLKTDEAEILGSMIISLCNITIEEKNCINY